MIRYTNRLFKGTYEECCKYTRSSLPKNNHRNWPKGPWKIYEEPVSEKVVNEFKTEDRVRMLKQERDRCINEPIANIEVARSKDRENIQGALANWEALVGSPEDEIAWIAADDTVILLDKAALQTVVEEYAIRKHRAYAIYAELLNRVNNGDFDVKWPSEI